MTKQPNTDTDAPKNTNHKPRPNARLLKRAVEVLAAADPDDTPAAVLGKLLGVDCDELTAAARSLGTSRAEVARHDAALSTLLGKAGR